MENKNNVMQLSPQEDAVNKYLALQEKELQLKADELQLRQTESTSGYNYSMALLDANAKDRKEIRDCQTRNEKYRYVFCFLVLLIVSGFLCFALAYNKEIIALELIKFLGYTILGGISGYGFKTIRDQNQAEKK